MGTRDDKPLDFVVDIYIYIKITLVNANHHHDSIHFNVIKWLYDLFLVF